MRSALFPLSIQGGCCRSREPTVWGQLIAGSVSTRRASCIDPANCSRRYEGLRVWAQFTTSPRNRRMKEKELRFALVCYGGVSLVLYMHGVIKEILKLSRASKAYHSAPQSEQREHQSYEAATGDDGRPHDTEDVYFTLLQSIGRTLSLRVIVDSIAGASAGGSRHATRHRFRILVLDMYEHAYHMDYGAAAARYVDVFM